MAASDDVIRLVEIRDVPLDPAEILALVDDPAAGGATLFVGTVRDHDGGRGVTALQYSAHPGAVARMREVAEKVAADHDVRRLAAVHRVGDLAIGDLAVVVAVSCGHRGEAFVACRDLIDTLKAEVPIWKHQLFADGTTEWVGTP
ncbi:MAG: molybdenum cofactor biosynthesis protein MoaE [Sporichthyaceae bacterium]